LFDGCFNKVFDVIQLYGSYWQHTILMFGWRGIGKLQRSHSGVWLLKHDTGYVT